jgi:hypothetical protein
MRLGRASVIAVLYLLAWARRPTRPDLLAPADFPLVIVRTN